MGSGDPSELLLVRVYEAGMIQPRKLTDVVLALLLRPESLWELVNGIRHGRGGHLLSFKPSGLSSV
jgi:hypothetical protein